ncbi:MAG: hypothetical protein KC708_21820 [Anaerolineae bacterium]|nr:hypothetical protein [Anaerolineae bacterium]
MQPLHKQATHNWPNFTMMTDKEFVSWVSSLTTEFVYANLQYLTRLVTERFGGNALISTATYESPKIIFVQ